MLQAAIERIKEAREPLTVYLDDSAISDEDTQLIAEALKEACVPITLYLSHNNIGIVGVRALAEAMREALVPITLHLDKNRLGDDCAGVIADAIESVRFPFLLDLSCNDIGSAGAELIAEAIMRAKVALTLELGNNNIGDDGVRLIADAIKLAKVKLALYLHNNCIGDTGAGFIADAIKETPSPLFLDLGLNMIADSGAEYLAKAMIEAQCAVTLDLYWNNIGIRGAKLLAHALKHAKTPVDLYLSCGMDPDIAVVLNDAVTDNFIVDARLDPSRFLTRVGFSLCKKILEEKFNCPFMASIIQEYIGSFDLAWTEVAAIRAVEGASHENKYSSINSDLLNATYFTPLANQEMPELVEASLFAEQPQSEQFGTIQRFRSSTVFKRSRLTDYKWTPLKRRKLQSEDEEEQCYNLDKAEDDGSDSSSSDFSIQSFDGSGGSLQLSESVNQQTTTANPLSSIAQPAEQEKALQEDNNAAEQWLMTLFAWIKDLSLELQQQALSSFNMQQMLKLLWEMTDPHKFITDQLNSKPIEEVFTTEYQRYYGQDISWDHLIEYAKVKSHEFSFMDSDNVILSNGMLIGLLPQGDLGLQSSCFSTGLEDN
jgi:hypothetical protein